MNKLRIFFFFITLIIFPKGSFSQLNPIKQFSEDPIAFLGEVQTMLEATNMDKKEVREFMMTFTLAWNSPKCNNVMKKSVVGTCNLMIKKKLRILPEYKSYLTSVMNFINSTHDEDNFLSWQECVNKILNGKFIKNFSDYMDMSENLFSTNSFYNSAVVRFSSNTNKYLFEYDSVPIVVFPKLNLRIANNQNDTNIIYNTRGVYYPNKGIFVGEGGKVNWVRTGIEETVVWAELKKYQISLKTSGYTADSVVFYNKNYFQKPLVGKLTEKVVSEKEGNMTYPRFDSYNKRIQILNIAKEVNYDGGFSQRGPKVLGSGSKEEDARLIFYRDKKVFLVVGSKLIGITNEKLTAEAANIKFYFGLDSITHPSVNMKLMIADRKLSLVRTAHGVSKSPYINSFHDIEMYFEELTWKMDDPKMDFGMLVGNSQEDALFESSNYFRGDRYDGIQGLDQINPLIQMRDYLKKMGGIRDFDGDQYARYLKFSPNDVRPVLVRLSVLGFITYNAEDDIVHVNEKLFTYIAARAAHIDYDVIQFPSVIRSGVNASINLLNYDMSIMGVQQISMSDSQNVAIYPAEQKILLKKNRDFTFAGLIHAGRFDFFGREFAFDYTKFKIDLKNVDSLRIMVKSREPNAYGEYPLVKVRSVIESINGELEIDNPANKSGRKDFPVYPIFTSFKESYTYYDKKSIQNGKYKKDKFYFKLDPFVIDSLDNFSNEGLNFKGSMESAGIFPTFREALTLQEDYSLGFISPTPPQGYPMYGGKGTYAATIKLSNKGLRGDGELKYVTSISKSNDFLFLPDSTKGIAQSYDVVEQKLKPEYPQIHGQDAKILWIPAKDIMHVWNNKEKKFQSYNGQATFDGRLSMNPTLLSGNGVADFSNAKLQSNLIKFKSQSFDADTADFSLKALDLAGLAFSTDNVKARIDFTKRMGEFKSNGKGSIVKFPVNQYICYMENFSWYMDDNQIELGSSNKGKPAKTTQDLNLEGPEFISVHPNQDSLRFQSPVAKYDLKKYVITAKEVKYINVADARIYPENEEVIIEKAAVMRPFTNAKIVANSITKYHNLYNCTVNVTARKKYTGSGSYDYVDELKNKQTFYFSNVSVDTTFQTFAETTIPDSAKISLSPNFEYIGKVKLKATANFLVFDGAVRIAHECTNISKSWIKFESEINPNNIYIPIPKEPMDINGTLLAASIMVTRDSTHLYSAFLSPAESTADTYVLPADGFLFFDKGSREYRISNKEKLSERSLPGNYLSLNTSQCKIYGEGSVHLGGDLGQVKLEGYGSAVHFLIPNTANFDMLMAFDFFFDDAAMGKMAEAISSNIDLKSTDFSRPVFEKGMREMLGKEQADKLISQLNLYGSFKKFPDELKKTMFFNDVKMSWNKDSRSYISSGKLGLGSMDKTQINKYVDGKIEVIKKRGGDVLNVYIEIDPNNWYYFTYNRGTMLAISSNEAFNNAIKELKPEKRQKEGDKSKKEPNYSFNLTTVAKKTQFLRKSQSEEETQ